MAAFLLRPSEEERIYQLLREQLEFDHHGQWKGDFLYQMSQRCREYRFQGNLGFGGKLWNSGEMIYVNCYPEDINQERQVLIDRVNATFVQWSKEGLLPKFRGL